VYVAAEDRTPDLLQKACKVTRTWWRIAEWRNRTMRGRSLRRKQMREDCLVTMSGHDPLPTTSQIWQ
jgi:hypothetical protein